MYRYIIILILLGGVACQSKEPTSASPLPLAGDEILEPIDDTLALAIGTSQFIGGTQVEIGFPHIYNDSRCPSDVVCKWEGMARIAVWLKAPDQDTLFLEPIIYGYMDRSSPGGHKTVLSDHFGITLQ